MQAFQGLSEETYTFFWDIAFHNELFYFEENRERYNRTVKEPLLRLAQDLADTALEMDPEFNVRPAAVVSRIRRDTRYAPIDAPYRDHAYLTYRHHGMRIGESFSVYTEFERTGFGYGMGMYSDNPPFMEQLRKRILARQDEFLAILSNPALQAFRLVGTDFKRPRYTDAPTNVQEWLNKRRFSVIYESAEIPRTFQPAYLDEVRDAFLALKPLYKFIVMG